MKNKKIQTKVLEGSIHLKCKVHLEKSRFRRKWDARWRRWRRKLGWFRQIIIAIRREEIIRSLKEGMIGLSILN